MLRKTDVNLAVELAVHADWVGFPGPLVQHHVGKGSVACSSAWATHADAAVCCC